MKHILTLLLLITFYSSQAQTIVTIGTGTAQSLYGPIYIFSNASTNTHSWNLGIYDQAEIINAGGFAGKFNGISWYKTDTGAYAKPDASLKFLSSIQQSMNLQAQPILIMK